MIVTCYQAPHWCIVPELHKLQFRHSLESPTNIIVKKNKNYKYVYISKHGASDKQKIGDTPLVKSSFALRKTPL
jgi:hypothetical protein